MAASLTALATVVWSDFAEASQPQQVELADEVLVPQPVKLAKIEHKQIDEVLLPGPQWEDDKPRPTKKPSKRKGRLDFGNFEGY